MSTLLRPRTLPANSAVTRIDANSKFNRVRKQLASGSLLCVTDTYPTALTLYSWLKKDLRRRFPERDYESSRRFRNRLRLLTENLLVPIVGQRVHLKKAPEIPWLQMLYPEGDDFFLPLPDVLGLNGSWQWYHRGVDYAFLCHRVHPYYGVYFPTRYEHLGLFDVWLKERTGVVSQAIDVGVGAGLLTFLLIKHDVSPIYATDSNPNAIHSTREDLSRLGLLHHVTLEEGDLLGHAPEADLIVCNPPWVPGISRSSLDQGSFYTPDLFPRLFHMAHARLKPQGRLVLLFSNFAQVAGVKSEHPIEQELSRGGRFRLAALREVPAECRGRDSSWLTRLKKVERVQLWELGLSDPSR